MPAGDADTAAIDRAVARVAAVRFSSLLMSSAYGLVAADKDVFRSVGEVGNQLG